MCKVPEIPPVDDGADTSLPESAATASYSFCLERAAQATAQGDITVAALWIRQAEQAGSTLEKRSTMAGILSAYGRLVNDCCLQMRNLTVRSGNITLNHERSAAQLTAICAEICRLQESTDQAQLAAVLKGLVSNLALTVERSRQTNPLVTAVPSADAMMTDLKLIQQNLKDMGIAPCEQYGSNRSLLELARLAVSNAEFSLTWFFPTKLCLWDKADFMCRQANDLLAVYLSATGSDKPSAEFESVLSDLKSAQAALGRQSYRDASATLQRSGKTLDSCIAAL